MKYIILIITLLAASYSFAQDNNSQETNKRKVGWFISPEAGAFIHSDYISKTLGASFGVKLFNNRLKLGWQLYGAPGPINSKQYVVAPSDGQLYKGQSTISLTSDHGAMGLYIAPIFNFKKLRLEIPIGIGMMGSGFYLSGEDRETPDGARVSVWEDKLMDSRDAGFSNFYELGARVFLPLKNEHISLGLGLHYSLAPTWEAYAEPTGSLYDQIFRFSIIASFESK